MRRSAALACLAALLASAGVRAADVPAPSVSPARTPPQSATSEAAQGAADPQEPNVKRTVIDDPKTHIEELRVRGQLQSVKVSTKGGAPDYEIVVPQGGVDQSDFVIPLRGASGRRVWNIFRF
jgi:hypothetical protein